MHVSRKRGRRVLLALLIGVAAAFVPIPSFSAQRAMHVDSETVATHTAAAAGSAAALQTAGQHVGISTFKMVGVSWEGPVGDGARIRTRSDGKWGEWQTLERE